MVKTSSPFPALALAPLVAFAISSPALAITQHGKRHLVYSFDIGVNDDSRTSISAAPMDFDMNMCAGKKTSTGGDLCGAWLSENVVQHGVSSYNDATSDKGEIRVDIQGLQPDGALVVTASESADRRSNAATDCLIYPTTNVTCAGAVTPEEFAVMRTLSPKFLEPAYAEPGRSWRIADGTQGVPSNFKVSEKASSEVTITEDRAVKMTGANRGTIATEARYVYDQNRLLPTMISEYTLVHYERDAGHTRDTTVDITARLTEDSAVGKE